MMAVLKFRSIEAMDQADRGRRIDTTVPGWHSKIAALWDRSRRLNPRSYPPGVYKFRSVDEAEEQREQWLLAHMRALRKMRSED